MSILKEMKTVLKTGDEKKKTYILRLCCAGLAIILTVGMVLPLHVNGDYKDRYYSNPALITVGRGDQIVDYLDCERIAMTYPNVTGRCDVNMGRDSKGNLWAAVTGVATGSMQRLFRSQDGGKTWTSIQLAPTQGQELVAFTVLDNDNLLLAAKLDKSNIKMYISSDMGNTWTQTTNLKPDPYPCIGEGFLSLTQLKNGQVLFPVTRYDDTDPYVTGVYGGVFVSADGGNSFPVVNLTSTFWMEAHILELQSGNLLMAIRYQRNRNVGETDEEILALGGNVSPEHPFNFKNVFLADSGDKGVTWTNFRPLRDSTGKVLIKYDECHGQLVQVPDGRVVLLHDNRNPSEERDVRARVSSDGGQTWDPDIYYMSFGRGDPASVALDDGTIVTVTGSWPYGPSGPIGPSTVKAIRWKLPPITTPPTVNVLSPTSTSKWGAGSQQKILWSNTGIIAKVKIDLYKGNTLSSTLTASTDNKGSYTWNIPVGTAAASNYKIRISDASNPAIYGDSVAFSISRAAMVINRSKLIFGAVFNGVSTSPQSVMISKKGSGTLEWSVSDNASWLACSPTSGANDGIITVNVEPAGLTPITYQATITIADSHDASAAQTVSVTLNVYNPNQTYPPFGSYDTPLQGASVSSSVPFTGWVLDDIGVKSVKLYRENGNSLVYIGDGVFVEGARPDVEQVYSNYPANYRAGWGYLMLTNLFNGGSGTFIIHAIAEDMEGHKTSLGTKTIIVDNLHAVKPFGAIDTPAQGGAASGKKYLNFGWVLTPQPNHIPVDGSTINVYVDGVKLGHPVYNLYRQDIATLFPSYANSQGAVGYYYLDTTGYKNGVHTIGWTATDNAGNTDGIGSRFFSIQNTGSLLHGEINTGTSRLDFPGILELPVNNSIPGKVKVKRGYNEKGEFFTPDRDREGVPKIVLKELDRVEIRFGDEIEVLDGYMTRGNRLYDLPIGSTLDTASGCFYWQTAPGFIGEYRFVLAIKSSDGNISGMNLSIKIVPRFPGPDHRPVKRH